MSKTGSPNGAKQHHPLTSDELDRAWFDAAYNGILEDAANLPEIKISKPGNEVSNMMLRLASLVKGPCNKGAVTPDKALNDFMQAYPYRKVGANRYGDSDPLKAFNYQWQRHLKRATPRGRIDHSPSSNGAGQTVKPNPPAANSQPPTAPTPKPDLNINTKYPKTNDYLKALKWLDYSFRLNLMGHILEMNGQRMTDAQEAIIRNQMADLGLTSTRRVEDAYLQMAWDNRYHPIQEYLNNLVWDGQDHISKLINDYLVETTRFGEVALTRWLIGCIAKVFQTGDAQNYMMVWDGPQGIGKSHLARWLCPLPRYFVESQLQPDNKDHQVWALQNWIWEVGELQSTTRRSDREALKHFITQKEITVRKAYGKNELAGPMLCNFIGTINNTGTGFLSDPTGNRRFVTIYIANINHAYTSELDISQVWAQAMSQYKSGISHHLAPEEQTRRDEINNSYLVTNPLTEFFWDVYELNPKSQTVLTSVEIIRRLEQAGLKGNQVQLLKDLAELMKKHNIAKVRTRLPGDSNQKLGYMGIFEK